MVDYSSLTNYERSTMNDYVFKRWAEIAHPASLAHEPHPDPVCRLSGGSVGHVKIL
jgi:hypothetical protein